MSRNNLSPASDHSLAWRPPRWVWIVIVVCAIVIVIVQLLRSTWDPAITNITSFVCTLIAIGSVLWWHTRRSPYGLLGRLLPLLVTVTAAAVFLGVVQVRRFSGAMRPEFAWRWQPAPDEILGRVEPLVDAAPADLSSLTAQDFPRFLGPQGNLTLTGPVLDRDWSARPPRLVWRRELGAGWSAFSAVNGFAVTLEQRGPRELVTCYEVSTGDLRWSHALAVRHESLLGYVGPRSTPTIHGGRVYVFGATGIVRCLEGTDGGLIWQKDLLAEVELDQAEAERFVPWGRAASPLVWDDKLILPVGGSDGGPRISLIALDLATGSVVWRGGQEQTSYASPIAAQLCGVPQVVVVNQDVVTGHDVATGQQLWAHDWPSGSAMDASTSNPLPVGTTAGLENCLFLSKGYGLGAELIRVENSAPGDWSVETVWKNKSVMKTKLTNVAMRDGFVYGLDDGILSCVALASGERRWKKGRYGHGQILLVQDLLLVQSERGELDLVVANPESYERLGSIQAIEGQSWNNLCLYGRYLLLRNSEQAACYELAVIAEDE